jgi:hypothetical protein
MTSSRLRAAFAVVLLTVCVGQAGRGDDRTPIPGLLLIHRILESGHFSGALAYSGCGFDKRVPPDLPPLGVLDESGMPKEILTKLFAADPLMQVTQEDGSMIRMMEKNVPTDLLEVKIHHLSFFPSDASGSAPVYGPRMALIAILSSPAVVAFGKAHNIRGLPSPDKRIMMPGDCCGPGRIVHGELDDITVSQALDYVLQTFPGYWVYENCVTKEGERSVYFNFY